MAKEKLHMAEKKINHGDSKKNVWVHILRNNVLVWNNISVSDHINVCFPLIFLNIYLFTDLLHIVCLLLLEVLLYQCSHRYLRQLVQGVARKKKEKL